MLKWLFHKIICRQKHYTTRYKFDQESNTYIMYLECIGCEYRTPGWDVTPAIRGVRGYEGDV